MNDELMPLISQLRSLEKEIERKLEARRDTLRVQIKDGRVLFEHGILEQHRKLKTRIDRFLLATPLKFYLTAPVIYALVIPFAFLDVSVTLYQWICFKAWRIAPVSRSGFIALDRHRLAYLNGIQKLNCTYCAYANGVISYVREVAARTEQYWCPIKHAVRARGVHERYRDFLDFGDADGFVKKSAGYRRQLREMETLSGGSMQS